MKTPYDVIIIGAGPAGATAASILADNNFNTLILEKEKLPRTKICGGGVSNKALNLLKNSNIKLPELKTFTKGDSVNLGTFDSNSVEHLANVKLENAPAYFVDRDEFDYALIQESVSKGAELMENSRVKNIRKENGNFIVSGNGFSIKSKYLLCADGVNGISAKLLGFRDKWKKEELFLCIESTVTDYNPPAYSANFYFGGVKWGYLWFFDKGDHASVGIAAVNEISNLKQLFESFIKNCGYINSTEIKMHAWRIPAIGGIPGDFTKGDAIFIGDAAGLVDPFLGEGIFYAIQSGKIAAECVMHNEINKYNGRINNEIMYDLKYARILVKLIGLDPKRFVKLLSKDKTIARDGAEIVFGNLTYKQFLKNTFKKILMNPFKLI